MTPSTTDTAAREVMAKHDADAVRCNFSKCGCDYCAALRPTLTQQQGGEQEARELLAAEYELDGADYVAQCIRRDSMLTTMEARCLRAISAALRTKQPAASEGDVVRSAQHVKNIATMPNEIRSAILEALAAYDPERMARCGNTSKQAAGEAVDSTFAEWLASEMPAGTVIGDPTWWANRIARQYQVRCAPRHPADEELSKSDKDYILRTQNLLLGFMLDCNAIGAKEAGVNLARSMKEKAALQAGTP